MRRRRRPMRPRPRWSGAAAACGLCAAAPGLWGSGRFFAAADGYGSQGGYAPPPDYAGPPPGAYAPRPPMGYAPPPPEAYARPPGPYGRHSYAEAEPPPPAGPMKWQASKRWAAVKPGAGESTVGQDQDAKFKAAQAKAAKVGVENLTKEDVDGLTVAQIKELRGY